ncbi:F-box protein [Iris pallida]|uniref:F-box protein n=1 Tax=Iris pallida TaxID=29817 RepID=A0AAX6I1J5_IRIPA|nr:F-box protein [Iris pallida]
MESVPDAIVQHILSQMSNARDISSCICISRRWRDSAPFVPSLYFPRNAFDSLRRTADAESVLARMVRSAVRLEHLVVYCPFPASSLAPLLSLRSPTLRSLELRLDSSDDSHLDSLASAANLHSLKLWGVSLTKPPNWESFKSLRVLEIVGASMRDDALKHALLACPSLTDLALLGCDGVGSVEIKMQSLEKCRLDFLGPGNISLSLSSPALRALEIQGFSWVHVDGSHRLNSLCIAKNSGRVYRVELGKLQEVEYLCLRGVQWSWGAISSLLHYAAEVKHLVMKIEFSGDHDTLQPFPEIDLVDFFNAHPKLRRFEIHGAMFAALCQKNSLKNLDWRFAIPCLEEVLITVRSPLNPEQKMNTLESLVRCGERLRKVVIRISQMKNCHDAADEFFEEICRFKFMNQKIVHIE